MTDCAASMMPPNIWRLMATGSALTNFVAHHGLLPVQDKKFAMVFMVPTNAIYLPHLLRDADGYGQSIRFSTVEPDRRERSRVHSRVSWCHGGTCSSTMFLSVHLPAAIRRPWLHAARREARFILRLAVKAATSSKDCRGGAS
jgi:hypothetical protein